MKIDVKNVVKTFKHKKALKNLTFTLEGPKIIGFLGHNGAGKTTFLNLLAGLIAPTSGSISVNGENVFNAPATLRDICFIAESGNFQEEMTIAQALKANSFFYPQWDEALARELLEVFALNPKDKVRGLSKGMVSALGIITGFASNAGITIFDEPYIGLDVAARNTFYDLLIEQQTENPRLFILSTHLIDEASDLFEEILILNEGQLLLQKAAEEWHQHIVAVKGNASDVEQAIHGLEIIYQHMFMQKLTAVIYSDGRHIEGQNIKLERVSLQDMLVYLSKQQKARAIK
ncbi:ABC transporter ATP-binding protein [Lysinibacillus pakistanensis]|uniref:ABC transporter ATP-binding protein n=1 Tax=Lysinibacillus pakistanensis TaxID=759811 RepID=A0AAX3WYA6_9BACI|nr:ABC transporter ATP-binding protein [Lysinibacillus pakistanensis]MDM5232354.1 ABC transporter ATP-binding protein [Lysinibacillus pakistanensis]WHY47868.1 ABC transporter ATP-binding protein [Lysinibacillus pakistanensis]WHY52880.1 ABC transporter ATP-binding protein [Lysinibacillus pakistanensis]